MKKQPSNDENFDSGNSPKQVIDARFERVLIEYLIILKEFKQRCINKYESRAERWFGV